MGASTRDSTSGSPISLRHQSSAANSLSNCGGDQSPPHSPTAGRRSTSTAIDPSLSVSAINRVASRDPRARLTLPPGNSPCRPSSAATHPALLAPTLQPAQPPLPLLPPTP